MKLTYVESQANYFNDTVYVHCLADHGIGRGPDGRVYIESLAKTFPAKLAICPGELDTKSVFLEMKKRDMHCWSTAPPEISEDGRDLFGGTVEARIFLIRESEIDS